MDEYVSIISTIWVKKPYIWELCWRISLVQVVLMICFSRRNLEHDSRLLFLWPGWNSLRLAIWAYSVHVAALNVVVNWGLQILIEGLLLPLKRCIFLDLGLCSFWRRDLGLKHIRSVGVSSQNYVVLSIVRLGWLVNTIFVNCCLALFDWPWSLIWLAVQATERGLLLGDWWRTELERLLA